MATINKVMLMGNLTADPEAKSTPQGTAITNLRLAINRKTKDGGDDTTFIDVTCFGRVAEIAAQYLGKGHPVFIEGRLSMDGWQDKQTGQTRTKHKVVAESLQLLSTKADNQRQGGYQQTQKQNNFTGGYQGQRSSYSRQSANYPERQDSSTQPTVNDDDIPF